MKICMDLFLVCCLKQYFILVSSADFWVAESPVPACMDTHTAGFSGVIEPSRAAFLPRERQLCHAGSHLWDLVALDKSTLWQKPCLDPEKGQERWKAQWSSGSEPCRVTAGPPVLGLCPQVWSWVWSHASLVMMCPRKLGTLPECQAAQEAAARGVPGWNVLSLKCGEF